MLEYHQEAGGSTLELADLFRGTGKAASQETFRRKVSDTSVVQMVSALKKLAVEMKEEMCDRLERLEGIIDPGKGEIVVSAKKNTDG